MRSYKCNTISCKNDTAGNGKSVSLIFRVTRLIRVIHEINSLGFSHEVSRKFLHTRHLDKRSRFYNILGEKIFTINLAFFIKIAIVDKINL